MATSAEMEARYRDWVHEDRLVFWKVARAFAAEAADQADLVQDMQLHLWNASPRFRGESKPSTWIYRICLNTALTWRRSAERRAADRHDPHDDAKPIASPAPDPGADAEHRDILERLYGAIRALPGADRSLVLLQLDGLSYDEIGAITGMTENHVGVALTRARKRIAELMKGVTDELE